MRFKLALSPCLNTLVVRVPLRSLKVGKHSTAASTRAVGLRGISVHRTQLGQPDGRYQILTLLRTLSTEPRGDAVFEFDLIEDDMLIKNVVDYRLNIVYET